MDSKSLDIPRLAVAPTPEPDRKVESDDESSSATESSSDSQSSSESDESIGEQKSIKQSEHESKRSKPNDSERN